MIMIPHNLRLQLLISVVRMHDMSHVMISKDQFEIPCVINWYLSIADQNSFPMLPQKFKLARFNITVTRKHSSRMRTACLETAHASVSVATTRCHSLGVPKWTVLNMSLSDHYQMSLARGSTGLMSRGQSDVLQEAGGTPPDLSWGWVPYHVTFPMMHLM